LSEVVKQFFENDKIEVRMRPSFFPFTEPSAEVDIRMPGSQKWLEVLGSGMIHPKVLQNVGIDSKVYSGFALGLGVERFAMLKYGIKDLRQFFDMDINWMRHFGFFAGASLNLNNGAKL
jgi:phenylalanyl-tRNA synthetase alpha chain